MAEKLINMKAVNAHPTDSARASPCSAAWLLFRGSGAPQADDRAALAGGLGRGGVGATVQNAGGLAPLLGESPVSPHRLSQNEPPNLKPGELKCDPKCR